MHQCCTPVYDAEFDQQHAENDMYDYLSTGPKKNTVPLLKSLGGIDLSGKTFLDIGGGIGAMTFESFKRGIASAQHVDISAAYSKAFQGEADKRGLGQRIQSITGDFVNVHDVVSTADVVVLDKVICCYKEFEPLVLHASQKADGWIAFSVPRNVWWVRLYDAFDNKWRALKGKPFPTYVHSTDRIDEILVNEGFYNLRKSYYREWFIAVYQRSR